MKKYLNIKEASNIVGLKEHVIRYWDSIDSKTNKLRIEGISTKSKGGTRYFNKDNLNKLQKLKDIIYENGNYNPSLILADKLLSSKKIMKENKILSPNQNSYEVSLKNEKLEKISQILKKMRILIK